jgi:hypothetical protein
VDGHPGDEVRLVETARQREERVDSVLLLVGLEARDRPAAGVAKPLAK